MSIRSLPSPSSVPSIPIASTIAFTPAAAAAARTAPTSTLAHAASAQPSRTVAGPPPFAVLRLASTLGMHAGPAHAPSPMSS